MPLQFILLCTLVCHLACSEPAPQPDPQIQAWSEHYQAGLTAFDNSRLDAAEQAFTKALTLAETLPAGDRRYARTAHHLAKLHVLRGELTRAENLYLRLREIEQSRPDDSPDKALTLDRLADVYQLQKKLPEAIDLHQQVLSFQQTHQGDEESAQTMQKLADSYRLQERYAEADTLAQRARAFTLRTQAHGYFLQGKYDKAEPVYRSALALQEKHLGRSHPDLSRTCYYMGRLYDAQDRHRQAEHFYRRALALAVDGDPDRARDSLDALLARAAKAGD